MKVSKIIVYCIFLVFFISIGVSTSGDKNKSEKIWKPMLEELHILICKQHKGTETTEDSIRTIEISNELMKITQKMTMEEMTEYSIMYARSLNTETCK